MLLSALPLGMVDTAWAISSRDTVVDSGTCGGTLNNSQLMKWTLTSDGTLTISGEGNMFGAPWSQYKSKIKKVVIGEGVKSISDNAFHYYENLRSVSLPSTLTSIGEAAFWACSSLQSITLPNNLTNIGLNAFRACHSLTQVLIPASVTSIDGSAFECCTGLTDVVFEGNSLEFGSGATFYDCTSLKNVFFNGTRADWTASRGSSGSVLPAAAQIYYKNDLISSGTCGDNSSGNNTQWKLTKAGTLIITVGTGYTEGGIADFAYGKAPWYQDIYDSGIRCLIIGSGIKTIGSYAFADCTDLAEIIVPDGVISIGNGAFLQNSGAKRVVLPPSTVYIGHGALRDCSALTSVSLPDSMSNRLFLDMFEGCTNLKSVDIPDGITDIYEGDLASCPNWTDIYYDNWGRVWNRVVSNVRDSIPDRMNVHFKDNIYDSGSCGENVTWTLTADGTLTISGTGAMTDYTYDSRSPWYSCRTYIKRVVMQQGVTSIGGDAFWDCSGLTSVTIPDGVTSIGGDAFWDCSGLTSVTIPDGVTSIGGYAFRGCSGLTSVTIPEGVTSIGDYAFDNCSSLTDIYYGGYGTDWQKLNVSIPTSATVHFKDNIYGKGDCGINVTWELTGDGTLIISGTGRISNYSHDNNAPWYSCRAYIKRVVIQQGVRAIGDRAFWDCSGLTSVTIPDGVTSIGDYAFAYCVSLTSATIPEGVTSIGWSAFENCTALTFMTIPEGVTSIGNSAFSGCSGLTSVTIPSSVTSIGWSAFKNCTALTFMTIPESVTYISGEVFSNCVRLARVTIPKSVTEIGSKAFYYCDSLTDVYYAGTAADWAKISISEGNEDLTSAALRCAPASLSAPTVTGGNDSQGRPTLKWKAVSGAAKYEVYRARSKDGDYIKYSTVTGTSYTNISYIENGNTYYYKVRALDASGTAGAWSSVVSVTYKQTLPAPIVTGGNDSQGRPTLKWKAVSGAAKYEVYRARSKNGDYIKYSTVTGTSYTNTSYIENGNTYYYKVRALKSSGTAGAWSSIVSVTYKQTLPAPTVTGGNDAQGRPTLKWNAVSGAAKYEVYRARSRDGSYSKYSTVTGTSYTNTSYIEDGNTYYYKVRALDANGTAGAWSSIVSVTYKQTLPAPTVTGGNDSQGRPTLKWKAVTGAAKYEVYRARSKDGDYIKYSTVTGTSYTNTSYIENGNTYYYKVRALDANGTAGAWSSVVSVTYKQTLPAPAVTGGNDSQGRPTLKWKAVTGAAKYEVYRARSKDGDYIKYSTVTGTSYTNTSYIENGNTYYYKVRALDANGTAGAWSSVVSVTYKQTLPAPTVTGGNDAQGRPTLTWKAVTGAAKYEVYRARSKDGDYIKYSTVTGTSYTNTSYIENGNTYYYKVRALDANGTAGAWSSIVSVTYRKPAAATVASGKCGDSAKWTLDAAGTLTISGSGKTWDFIDEDWNANAPWYDASLRLRIKKVVVEKGITYVGTRAFYDCSEMTSVSLPTTLETMGADVFMYCTGLTSVTIPDGVTFISGDFFLGCTSLKSVTLPDSLRNIGGCTFMYCASLTSVRLPANLRYITWRMFKDCTSLTSVTIPRGTVEVKKEAFDGCTSLKNVTFTGSAADWKGVTIRPGNTALTSAAIKCIGSTVLTAPTLTLSVSKKGQPTLKWSAVSGAAGYQLWCSYDGGNDYDPSYRWLANNDKTATSYTVPADTLKKGQTYTFKVRAVTSSGAVGSFSKEVTFTYNPAASLPAPTVTGGNDAQGRPTLKWNAVSGAAKYEVYRARSLNGDYIKYSTVTGTSYTNISYIENGNTYYYKVRALDANGTAGAWSSIVSVTYRKPAAATVASGKCGDSAKWTLDAAGTLTITGAGPMADYGAYGPWYIAHLTDIKKVVVQEGVTTIGDHAFANLSYVTSVTIPSSITSIGAHAFEKCRLGGAVTLPEGLTAIGDFAFSGSGMASLTLPESLRTIGNSAFLFCSLRELTIPDGVTSIGTGAFCNASLTSVKLPASGVTLGDSLFQECENLTDVTLPADLTVIGPSMFENCGSLKNVTIPSGVTHIGNAAFAACEALPEIRLPDGMEALGSEAFVGCRAVTKVYIPRSLTSIGEAAFRICEGLTDVYYGGTAAEWLAISVADRNDPLLNAALHCTGQSASRLDVPAMTLGEDCSDGKPTVWWPAVTGAERYEIWRAQAASDGSAPAASAYTLIVSADVTFHKDTTAEADTWYYYKVRAVSGSTYSDFSQEARRYCEAPPTMDTPEITSLELDDSGKPVLTWRTVEGAARYQVFRSEDNGFSYSPMGTVLPTGSDTITWTDTTAVSGTGYYYGVGCYDDNGHYSSFGGGEWWVTAR